METKQDLKKCGLSCDDIKKKLLNNLFNVFECEELGLINEFMNTKFIDHKNFFLIELGFRNFVSSY